MRHVNCNTPECHICGTLTPSLIAEYCADRLKLQVIDAELYVSCEHGRPVHAHEAISASIRQLLAERGESHLFTDSMYWPVSVELLRGLRQ
jgi:hypothetical protein